MEYLNKLSPEFKKFLESKYEIIEEVGSGGMGFVIKVRNKKLDRLEAIKILYPTVLLNEHLTRFEQEAYIIAQLDHPNIVTIYSYDNFDELRYIVMQYLPGGSLDNLLKEKGRLSEEEAIKITIDILSGLDYAHSKNIIHRDIKPSNILFDSLNRAVITDFGIAKIINDDSRLTKTGEFVGTPEFVSPEQAQGEKGDQQSDLYSVGILLYYMVTGRLPFYGDNPMSILHKHIYEEPKPPSEIVPVSIELENIIFKALEKDKKNRYLSAQEFINDLRMIENMTKVSNTITSNAIYISDYKEKSYWNRVFFLLFIFFIVLLIFFGYKYYVNSYKGEHKIKEVIITASSYDIEKNGVSYSPSNVYDGKRETAWAEGVEGDGIGEYLIFKFKYPVYVTKIGVIPGYDKKMDDKFGDRWYKNPRIKKAKLVFSDGSFMILNLRDSREMQYFKINKTTKYIKFIILDVYKSQKWHDTSISEIEIWGIKAQ